MGSPNPYISNGTCYSSGGQQMDSEFIPCGNDATGHKACCWLGDTCLDHNACFGIHNGGYLTYLAGCTDPDYLDENCPDKTPFEGQCLVLSAPCRPAARIP